MGLKEEVWIRPEHQAWSVVQDGYLLSPARREISIVVRAGVREQVWMAVAIQVNIHLHRMLREGSVF